MNSFPVNRYITIGIVCYREGKKLSKTLNSLKSQTLYHSIGEVLLVQNGICQETLKTAESFLEILPLSIIQNPVNNIGKARNLIIENSRYSLVAFTDGDCIVPENWIEQLLFNWDSCQNEITVGIGGPNRLPEQFLWQKTVNLSLIHPLGHGWSPQAWIPQKKISVKHIPTTNSLFLKDKVKKAGNFSPHITTVGEDVNLSLRLNKLGKIYLFPQPIVLNNYAENFFQVLKRLLKFGTCRYKQKDKLLWPAVGFFPILGFFLFIGIKEPVFLLPPVIYFICLIAVSLKIAWETKSILSLCLPILWFLQHCAYSLGAFLGILFRWRH